MAQSKAFLVADYIGGYFVFGIVYWILNGVLVELNLLDVTSSLYQWADLFWKGALVAFMVLGSFYLLRGLTEWDYRFKG